LRVNAGHTLLNYGLPGIGVAVLFAILAADLRAAIIGFPIGVLAGIAADISLAVDQRRERRRQGATQRKIPPLLWFGLPPLGALIGFAVNLSVFGGIVNGLLGVPMGLTFAFLILALLDLRQGSARG
jgi:hypothetical protein